MKGKDKFIDELLKSTQYINNAIMNGADPSMPTHGSNSPRGRAEAISNMYGSADQTPQGTHQQSFGKFIENGPYSVLKLKKKC